MDGAENKKGIAFHFSRDDSPIDQKGRIVVAKRKRDWLGPDFVMLQGEIGCLELYPKKTWEQLVDEIYSFPARNVGRNRYISLVFGLAEPDLNTDKEGRLVVPQALRSVANLPPQGKVILVGVGDHIELWSEAEYADYQKDPAAYKPERQRRIEDCYAHMKEM